MAKGRSLPKHTVTKKLKWVPMEIYRVPLNPEQAVLTCCNSASRAMVQVNTSAGSFGSLTQIYQCTSEPGCGPSAPDWAGSS
jgi:hypothetical protein